MVADPFACFDVFNNKLTRYAALLQSSYTRFSYNSALYLLIKMLIACLLISAFSNSFLSIYSFSFSKILFANDICCSVGGGSTFFDATESILYFLNKQSKKGMFTLIP